MGKPTGFMEYARINDKHLSVAERVKNFNEFTPCLTNEEATVQAARCMDCGVPFCNNKCLNNEYCRKCRDNCRLYIRY